MTISAAAGAAAACGSGTRQYCLALKLSWPESLRFGRLLELADLDLSNDCVHLSILRLEQQSNRVLLKNPSS